jgi:hypothetical protein
VAEGQRALADALEHDHFEPAFLDQLDRRLEPVGREPGTGADAERVRPAHRKPT